MCQHRTCGPSEAIAIEDCPVRVMISRQPARANWLKFYCFAKFATGLTRTRCAVMRWLHLKSPGLTVESCKCFPSVMLTRILFNMSLFYSKETWHPSNVIEFRLSKQVLSLWYLFIYLRMARTRHVNAASFMCIDHVHGHVSAKK